MDQQQAAKTIEENAMYLALLDDEAGNEELKAALFEQMLAAKQVLAAHEPGAPLLAATAQRASLREVSLTRDTRGMCIVSLNGREVIRDNGDVISHYATPDWLASFGA